jgi:hypothetical protein
MSIDKGIEFWMLGLHTERVADIALTKPEAQDITESFNMCPAPREYRGSKS